MAQDHLRFLVQSGGSQVERPEAGWLGVWVVADVWLPASTSGDGQSLVQISWARQSSPKVRCVTIVEETAVYGPVRTVVWEDGGREAPSYPIFISRSVLETLFQIYRRQGPLLSALY